MLQVHFGSSYAAGPGNAEFFSGVMQCSPVRAIVNLYTILYGLSSGRSMIPGQETGVPR